MTTCARCGNPLTERYHIAGRDYCSDCQSSVTRPPDPTVESVRGIVIGGNDLTLYVFVTQSGYHHDHRCKTDQEAIDWFKDKYPDAYAQGAEMRVYNI